MRPVRFWAQRTGADPWDWVAYNRLADGYIRRARQTGDVADYGRAEAALNASLEARPGGNYEALVQLAAVRAATHRFGDALDLAAQAITLDPGKPYGYGVLGDALLALGRYDEAARAFSRMVVEAPGLASFSRLAFLLELRGETERAELNWRNAISTDSGRRPEDSAWAHVQLGYFYFGTGDLGAAADAYERAAELFPGYVHALAGLAKIEAARTDYHEAISLYAEVVERYPNPEYVSALGDVYQAAGLYREAARQYDLVGVIDRLYRANGVNTDLQMALFFADHDLRLEESLRQARAAYEQRPSIQAADALAWALFKNGRLEEARTRSDEALRLGTKSALMLFHAAVIRHRLGDLEQAREYLGRALEMNPRFSVLYADEAARLLQTLQRAVPEP